VNTYIQQEELDVVAAPAPKPEPRLIDPVIHLQCPFKKGLTFPLTPPASDENTTLTGAAIGDIPFDVVQTLPTFIHTRVKDAKKAQWVAQINNEQNLEIFLNQDLDFSRLNAIHSQLWMCGRPMNARALHKQQLMGRRVVITEQADLHLLTYSDIVMLKPLPAYMLSTEVWKAYLCKEQNKALHEAACGMLLSYIWLIRSANDFKLAQDESHRLLPEELTFTQWRRIVMESLQNINPDTLHQVNKRFQFGELRLGRINKIYRLDPRFTLKNFVRGYLYGYNRYGPFLQRNVSWILGVSVLFSLALSAMQVGTGVDKLKADPMFNNASFGFVLFVCVMVLAVLAFVIVFCSGVYIYNMFAAIHHSRNEQSRRKKLASDRGYEKTPTIHTAAV
jgi:hypothetical protein